MTSLDHRFSTLLRHTVSFTPNRWIIALSGGVDSRVLLDLMHHHQNISGERCMAIHVHHGLSPHADRWAERCQTWCQQYQIPLRIEHITLNELDGESVEEKARDARYQALSAHMTEGDVLLTGQHRHDQLETFLLALRRGSGPKGLSAMASIMPFAKGWLARPLLSVEQGEIEDYAKQQRLSWVEDESNQDRRYDRNFLRQEILPPLLARWPSLDRSVARSARLCAEQEALLDELLTPHLNNATRCDGSIQISYLTTQTELTRFRLLRMWLDNHKARMPSEAQLSQLWNQVALAKHDANPELMLNQGQIRRYGDGLYWLPTFADVSDWRATLTLNLPQVLPDNLGEVIIKPSAQGALAIPPDAHLDVIFNPQGLTAHPVQRGHSRQLKKLFQEYGVPSWLRRRTPILLCNGQVAAVAGLFVDRTFAGQQYEFVWHKNRVFVPQS
ncbi:tRNA lysidine(34) synthetase TilS [Vibrio olivae]|uniref:tRNA(Ile)-lysidine synthase n=1 Tax=Vibrio olivae TaxID=1243002 RepID=A0ABV5HGT1_9VIBR